MGQGFLTEALGDVSALQPQAQAGAYQIVQQFRRGNARHIPPVKAEGLNDGIAQGWRFLTDDLAEAFDHLSCTVLVPCWDVEGGEDVFGFGGQGIGGCEVVTVEVDGDVL